MAMPEGFKAMIKSALSGGNGAIECHFSKPADMAHLLFLYHMHGDCIYDANRFVNAMNDKAEQWPVHYVASARKRIQLEGSHDDDHVILTMIAYGEEIDADPTVARPEELGRFEHLISIPPDVIKD